MKRTAVVILFLVSLAWAACKSPTTTTGGNPPPPPPPPATTAAPSVSSISPTSGPVTGGTNVTINGANFSSGASVLLGGIAATNVTVASATSITATTAAHNLELVDVVVRNSDAQQGFLKNGFQYAAALRANPGGPYSVDAGRNFVATGLGSTSTPYPIAHYYWKCGQDDHGKPCTPDSPTPTFEYPKRGKLGTPNIVYTLELTIVDTAGNSNTATTTVSVRQTY